MDNCLCNNSYEYQYCPPQCSSPRRIEKLSKKASFPKLQPLTEKRRKVRRRNAQAQLRGDGTNKLQNVHCVRSNCECPECPRKMGSKKMKISRSMYDPEPCTPQNCPNLRERVGRGRSKSRSTEHCTPLTCNRLAKKLQRNKTKNSSPEGALKRKEPDELRVNDPELAKSSASHPRFRKSKAVRQPMSKLRSDKSPISKKPKRNEERHAKPRSNSKSSVESEEFLYAYIHSNIEKDDSCVEMPRKIETNLTIDSQRSMGQVPLEEASETKLQSEVVQKLHYFDKTSDKLNNYRAPKTKSKPQTNKSRISSENESSLAVQERSGSPSLRTKTKRTPELSLPNLKEDELSKKKRTKKHEKRKYDGNERITSSHSTVRNNTDILQTKSPALNREYSNSQNNLQSSIKVAQSEISLKLWKNKNSIDIPEILYKKNPERARTSRMREGELLQKLHPTEYNKEDQSTERTKTTNDDSKHTLEAYGHESNNHRPRSFSSDDQDIPSFMSESANARHSISSIDIDSDYKQDLCLYQGSQSLCKCKSSIDSNPENCQLNRQESFYENSYKQSSSSPVQPKFNNIITEQGNKESNILDRSRRVENIFEQNEKSMLQNRISRLTTRTTSLQSEIVPERIPETRAQLTNLSDIEEPVRKKLLMSKKDIDRQYSSGSASSLVLLESSPYTSDSSSVVCQCCLGTGRCKKFKQHLRAQLESQSTTEKQRPRIYYDPRATNNHQNTDNKEQKQERLKKTSSQNRKLTKEPKAEKEHAYKFLKRYNAVPPTDKREYVHDRILKEYPERVLRKAPQAETQSKFHENDSGVKRSQIKREEQPRRDNTIFAKDRFLLRKQLQTRRGATTDESASVIHTQAEIESRRSKRLEQFRRETSNKIPKRDPTYQQACQCQQAEDKEFLAKFPLKKIYSAPGEQNHTYAKQMSRERIKSKIARNFEWQGPPKYSQQRNNMNQGKRESIKYPTCSCSTEASSTSKAINSKQPKQFLETKIFERESKPPRQTQVSKLVNQKTNRQSQEEKIRLSLNKMMVEETRSMQKRQSDVKNYRQLMQDSQNKQTDKRSTNTPTKELWNKTETRGTSIEKTSELKTPTNYGRQNKNNGQRRSLEPVKYPTCSCNIPSSTLNRKTNEESTPELQMKATLQKLYHAPKGRGKENSSESHSLPRQYPQNVSSKTDSALENTLREGSKSRRKALENKRSTGQTKDDKRLASGELKSTLSQPEQQTDLERQRSIGQAEQTKGNEAFESNALEKTLSWQTQYREGASERLSQQDQRSEQKELKSQRYIPQDQLLENRVSERIFSKQIQQGELGRKRSSQQDQRNEENGGDRELGNMASQRRVSQQKNQNDLGSLRLSKQDKLFENRASEIISPQQARLGNVESLIPPQHEQYEQTEDGLDPKNLAPQENNSQQIQRGGKRSLQADLLFTNKPSEIILSSQMQNDELERNIPSQQDLRNQQIELSSQRSSRQDQLFKFRLSETIYSPQIQQRELIRSRLSQQDERNDQKADDHELQNMATQERGFGKTN